MHFPLLAITLLNQPQNQAQPQQPILAVPSTTYTPQPRQPQPSSMTTTTTYWQYHHNN